MACFYQLIIASVQILASEVDFWDKDFRQMKLMQELKMYPPKVTILVYADNTEAQEETFTIKINGTKKNKVSEVRLRKKFVAGNLQDL